ncbi:hypothetical protein NIES2109_62030 (plasmid) [Nostoc sp. HK-01]|nr:hypothetical protein NIES2109_62030 [Nostoc sp. HK-01]
MLSPEIDKVEPTVEWQRQPLVLRKKISLPEYEDFGY